MLLLGPWLKFEKTDLLGVRSPRGQDFSKVFWKSANFFTIRFVL